MQILLQGGLNPELPIDWYEDLFRWMKANFPLAIHGLSPEEIRYIAEIENMSIRTVLERLVAAGLDSIPGGGAEILDDEIRYQISPLKCSTDTWLEVMREAHAPRAAHDRDDGVRLRRDSRATSSATSSGCARCRTRPPASPRSSAGRSRPRGRASSCSDDTTAMRYLRVFALSRLYLDNFPNLQVSWPTMGPEVGQVALRFGGNDFGSAMIEENVVSQAGAIFKLAADDIERYIRAAGFTPRRRNMRYERLAVA